MRAANMHCRWFADRRRGGNHLAGDDVEVSESSTQEKRLAGFGVAGTTFITALPIQDRRAEKPTLEIPSGARRMAMAALIQEQTKQAVNGLLAIGPVLPMSPGQLFRPES